MEGFEHFLTGSAAFLKLALEGISILCVCIGLLITLQLLARQAVLVISSSRRAARNFDFSLTDIRLGFGHWLSLALEFQLGADIVNTITAPSFETLGKLALLALIRTFLNFFLTRELNEEFIVTKQGASSQYVREAGD